MTTWDLISSIDASQYLAFARKPIGPSNGSPTRTQHSPRDLWLSPLSKVSSSVVPSHLSSGSRNVVSCLVSLSPTS